MTRWKALDSILHRTWNSVCTKSYRIGYNLLWNQLTLIEKTRILKTILHAQQPEKPICQLFCKVNKIRKVMLVPEVSHQLFSYCTSVSAPAYGNQLSTFFLPSTAFPCITRIILFYWVVFKATSDIEFLCLTVTT